MNETRLAIKNIDKLSANHYKRFGQALFSRASDVWVWDIEGNRYLDMLSTYSAASIGHNHPSVKDVFAKNHPIMGHPYYTEQEKGLLSMLTAVSGMEAALLMNTGAEAVETAVKLARKWAYTRKGVKLNKAEIIVASGNFHGRTTTVISFSDEEGNKRHFGPHTPGFKIVPYGDTEAIKKAVTKNTAAVLLEPIQGEGGVVVPPFNYITETREFCRRNNVLLMLDEIQTGLGRTGRMFCFEHHTSGLPDVLIVGKALGGGVYPVSGILASRELMDVFEPGEHGSTWGGNALACAVGEAAIKVILREGLSINAARQGQYLKSKILELNSPLIREVRGMGLLIGIELAPELGNADDLCAELLKRGIICKGAHETVLRLAPPLTIQKEHIDYFTSIFGELLREKQNL